MKNKFIKISLISVLFAFAFTSCKDDESPIDNTNEPIATFSITSPEANSMFMNGDTVWITGSVTATQSLHGLEIELKNSTTDSVVYFVDEHVHEASINFNKYWVNDVSGHSDMMLTVKAITDHDGGSESKMVHFHCHPKM